MKRHTQKQEAQESHRNARTEGEEQPDHDEDNYLINRSW